MADFIQNAGPLSQMSEEESPRLRTAPMSSYLSPAMAQEEEQAPEDNVSALYRQAKEKLMASRATGMDPLTTFLLAASQPGAGGTWGGISRGGIAAQEAIAQQAKSEEERQLKLLSLGLEEGKYKDTLEQRRAEAAARAEEARLAREFRAEEAEKARKAEDARAAKDRELRAEIAEQNAQTRLDVAAAAAGNKPIPALTQRRIFDLSSSAAAAEQDANRYNQVAKDFEELKPTGGLFGNVKEASKKAFGVEDYQSYVRKEFQEIMRQGMLQNLPKGAASDADVRIIREAQLNDFANPALVPEVLRAMARIKKRHADLLNFQSDFVSLNPLKTTLQENQEINGILIPKGSTLSNALKLFNEKNPYASSIAQAREEGGASTSDVDNSNPLLQ